jgi:glycosyltransferase involved in cell wall biosynthesis
MVQNIGLMITCNEEDCIEEIMNEHTKYFDKILILDGSTDRTEEIIRRYPQVKYFLKDSEIIDKLPNKKFVDGARQFLLAKAQEMFPIEGWFTLLHGDEVFHDDPNWVAQEAEKARAEKVNWNTMSFFLHTSDKGRDLAAIKSVQERVLWYCPGYIEIRQFRNKPGIHYDLSKHNDVLPRGIGWQIYKYFPNFKHYPYRSVDAVFKKKKTHQATGLSTNLLDIESKDDCFKDILPGCKVVRKFDGSFYEFEIKNQGSLFKRWLMYHRYLPAKIGPFSF